MTDYEMAHALIDALERKSDELQKLMDDLLAEMEKVPLDERAKGVFSKRFIELVKKQGALGHQLAIAETTLAKPGHA